MYQTIVATGVRAAPFILLAFGVSSIVLFGVLGFLRDLRWSWDLETLYSGGVILLRRINPYGVPVTLPELTREGVKNWIYAYPPNFSPVAILLAVPGYTATRWLMLAANLAAVGVMILYVLRLMRCPDQAAVSLALPSRELEITVAGAILASPFVAHVLWLGNTTLLVTAALLVGWHSLASGRHVLAGVFLALAAVKPQLVLLPGLWLLLERRWVTIASAAAASLVLSSYSMIVFGPVAAFRNWIAGIGHYLEQVDTDPGCLYCFGVGELLSAGNLPIRFIDMLVVAGLGLLWLWREHLTRLEILALLNALTVLFLPVQNYDLAVLAPLVGVLALLVANQQLSLAAAIAAMVLMYAPLRLVALMELSLLLRWREPVLLVLVALVLRIAGRRSPVGSTVRV